MQPTLRWIGDEHGHLDLLDQTLLPQEQKVLAIRDLAVLVDAIRRLAVRGAPAIGVAAGFGMVLGVRSQDHDDPTTFGRALKDVGAKLKAVRPTAVNLAWAVDRVCARGQQEPTLAALLTEARAIQQQDEDLCRRMGEHGGVLIQDGMTVLTHCNAGRLATAGDGTALAVMFAAHDQGRRFKVLADETRPLL
ncbi:MAG: S-methyl-5-thioribose-1-phosphate isomerase, partial [Planctomycetota bacterium]